jgi:hypothetical protein
MRASPAPSGWLSKGIVGHGSDLGFWLLVVIDRGVT